MQELFGGIDVGGSSVKYGVVTQSGEIVSQKSIPTSHDKTALIVLLRNIIAEFLQQNPNLSGVGVGFPSVVNPQDGCVYYPPNLPGWGVVPLLSLLREGFSLPIAVENDANVAALAESELGAGRDLQHFLYATLGTGVGGGIIINKRLFTGERGGAGEIGHCIIDCNDMPDADMRLSNREYRAGTLEERIGRNGILALMRSILKSNPESELHRAGPTMDVSDISAAAQLGDAAAVKCLERCGYLFGIGLSGVLATLDMRHIVVGGGISQLHDVFFDATLATLRERALPTISADVTVRKAYFGPLAGLVGAAVLGKYAAEQ